MQATEAPLRIGSKPMKQHLPALPRDDDGAGLELVDAEADADDVTDDEANIGSD